MTLEKDTQNIGAQENQNIKKLDLDVILEKIGGFGRFQKAIDVIIALSYFYVAFQLFIMYFMSLTPNWKCRHNSTTCILNGTYSGDDTKRCLYDRSEWYYTEPKDFSLVTEFDIHCDKKYLLLIGSSMVYIGWAVGAIILGYFGDKYGRKKLILPSAVIVLTTGLTAAWLPNIYCIIISRLIVGFFTPGILVQMNILISEIVSAKQRPLAVIIAFLFFPLGYSTVAFKAYLLQNWKRLCIVCTAPYFLVVCFYPFFPESVKWLQMNNKVNEAMDVLRRIGKWNKRELEPNIALQSIDLDLKNIANGNKVNNVSRLALFTIKQSFIWFVSSMSFFGLQLAAKELKGSLYSNFILLSLVQFPAMIVSIFTCKHLGRKKSVLVSNFLAGVSCLAIACIPSHHGFTIVRVTLGIMGKFLASLSFQSLYVWSIELFPTHFRSKGMGLTQVAARLGAAVAPWVVKGIASYSAWLPFIVLGVPAVIGSFIGLWLPETKVESKKIGKTIDGVNNEGHEIDL